MISNFNMKIKGFGPVTEADIDINRINVIGGLNATGKSTASKWLYIYLKANSLKRQDFAYNLIKPKMRRIINEADDDFSMHKFIQMDIPEMLESYNESKLKFFKDNEEYFELLDETNFYLTQKCNGGFYFKKVACDNMSEIYENLAKPYDKLDKGKIEILHRL